MTINQEHRMPETPVQKANLPRYWAELRQAVGTPCAGHDCGAPMKAPQLDVHAEL
jgi:hypothetical protein